MPMRYDFKSLMARLNDAAPVHAASMASIFLAIDSQRRLAMYLDSLAESLTAAPECADLELRPVEFLVSPSGTADALEPEIPGRPASAFPAGGYAHVNPMTILSGLASIAIGFFQSAQFQSLLRTAFKTGGLWLYMHTPGLPHDPASPGAAEFVSQVVGAGMFGYGIILSAVAHSGNGSPSTGTAAGPNAMPKPSGV
jgi:hypothetical protein